MQKAHSNMIKRILTAIVLIPCVIALLLFSNKTIWIVATSVLIGVAAFEWTGFLGRRLHLSYRLCYVGGLLSLGLWLIHHVAPRYVLSVAGVWWCVAFVLLLDGQLIGRRAYAAWVKGVCGCLVLCPTWVAFVWLHHRSKGLLLLLFVAVWTADTGAYIVGRLWGRSRIADRISQGKTLEGLLGGVVLTWLLFAILLFALPLPARYGLSFAIALWVNVLGLLGDLFESLLKRASGLKDSGGLLPGHGGVLDRIDSLTVVLPIVSLVLLF